MLTETDVRRMVTASIFSRGREIFAARKVYRLQTEEMEDGEVLITAAAKGSGSNIYDVALVYNIIGDELEECSCECPAFYSYSGLCKHCVAVLLQYIRFKKSEDAGASYWMDAEADEVGLMRREVLQPQTTPVMKQLLGQQLMKRTAPIIHNDTYGKVRLTPYVVCDGGSFQAEFKIGITHMYVLKDIFKFAENMLETKEHSYGQKLKFLHMAEAFEPESRPMAEFLVEWAIENRQYFMQRTYYGYPASLPKLRNIPLSLGEVAHFLDVLPGGRLLANINQTGEKPWQLSEQPFLRTVTITGDDNGIKVGLEACLGYHSNAGFIYFKDGLFYRVSKEQSVGVEDFILCLESLPDNTAYIQKEDVPLFCREILPALERSVECVKNNFDEMTYGLVPVSFEIYLDTPQRDFVTCKVFSVYGDKKYNVYDSRTEQGMRDLLKETEIKSLVSSYCNAYDESQQVMVLADDEEKMYELLVYGIPLLQEWGEVFISDALKRVKITQAPAVRVGVSLSGDMLELSMSVEDISRDQLMEILSKYNRRRKFYRLKNGDFINMDEDGIGALMELKQGLHLTDRELGRENITLPKYRALYLDHELKEHNAISAEKNKAFKALVRNMKTVEDNDFEIPPPLAGILREYQKRGFLWLKTLKHNGFGGILADDMGLGKTLQVIAFLLSEQTELEKNGKTVIVSPASLVYNWSSEFARFAPTLAVKTAAGTAQERREVIQGAEDGDILITSYDLLKRDLEWYEEIDFAVQVIDEAQFIKNHSTQAAKAVKSIKAGFRLALTGTPVENRLSELWSIFDYLMPGFLFFYPQFKEELETPIVQNQEEAAIERLRKMIRPFVLRRLKKDVLRDLPDKLEENLLAGLEGEQSKLYDAHVKRLKMLLDKQTEEEFRHSKIQILSELTKLRQLCCDPSLLYEDYHENSAKTEMCMELIRNAVNGGHKILLFSQFTTMLENLQDMLEKEEISYYTLTGATSKEKRKRLVDAFNADNTSVFCISLKAGGTGLNLTAADIVIHYDPWWNLAVQNQATDRAHRIGQKNVVSVYKLIVKGTIEENIIKLQEKKRDLAEQILGGEGMDRGSFTREELMELLK